MLPLLLFTECPSIDGICVDGAVQDLFPDNYKYRIIKFNVEEKR